MSAIACHKCKVYQVVDDQSVGGQKSMQAFKKTHSSHPTGNISVTEIAGGYRNLDQK